MFWNILTIHEIILFLFVAIASLLFHEVGHAFAAIRSKCTSVTIHIGRGKQLLKFKIGRLSVVISIFFFFNYYVETSTDVVFSKYEKLKITLGGPVANGLLAVLLGFVYAWSWYNSFIFLCLMFNLWLFVFNLIPLKIGQKTSDGYTIYKLLTNKMSE